jgi:uncharacterized protein
METPCIKICLVDERSQLCVGCHRTLDEISRWAVIGPGERRRIMAELPLRRVDIVDEAAR